MSTKGLDFGRALVFLRDNEWVGRDGWNGKDQYIKLVEVVGMRPFLAFVPQDGVPVPWVASQTDLLANDWHTIDKETLENG